MEIVFLDTSVLKSLFSISLSMFPILHMHFSFLVCFHSVWTVSWWRTNWIRYRPIRTYGYVVENLFVLNDYNLKAIEFWFLKSTLHTHTYTHIHTRTHTHTHTHKHAHAHTHTHTHKHTYTHRNKHRYTQTYTHKHAHTRTQTDTHIHIHISLVDRLVV